MIEKPPSDQNLIDTLHHDYQIEASSLTCLPTGGDMNAFVYKVQTQDGLYFVKLNRGQHPQLSAIILKLLHEAGIQNIIFPIKTTQGELTTKTSDFTMMVYPFIDGQDGFSRELTEAQWISLGKTMRSIHALDVPSSIQAMLRHESYSPKWRQQVRSLYQHIATNPAHDEIATKLAEYMMQHADDIDRLVVSAEALSQLVQHQSSPFVLCHADIHGGNVLMVGNDLIYIVDWDHHPMMARKERDLMFIGGGVANVWNKPHEIPLFYKGYGKTEIDLTMLAYYRHERIVEDIAIIGQQILLTKGNVEKRNELYQHFVDGFEPNGVVDIAFKMIKKHGS